MRKVFLHFAVTLDGMVSNVEQWVSLTDEALQDGSAWHNTVDAIIFGNNNYAPLAGYWQDAETSAKSAEERAFAKQINDMHKYVLSHGEVELVWRNSELLRAQDNAAFKQAIARLKNMPGKISPWIRARAPGDHFWKTTCGTASTCWSIPWSSAGASRSLTQCPHKFPFAWLKAKPTPMVW